MSTRTIRAKIFAPVDIAVLVYFRIAFGAIMLWEVWRYFHYGWIVRYWIEPVFHFKYFGFGWVQPWPGIGMYVHFVVLGILAACILIGLWYRIATILFFIGFTYVFLLDQMTYLNHFYLISLLSFLLIFLPAHKNFSIDTWWRSVTKSETAPAWSLWLLRFQIAVPYFYGGLAKFNRDWLACEPFRIWLSWKTDFPVIGPYFSEEWMVHLMSYGGFFFDLLIVPLLLWNRTRLYAFVVAVFFHLMNAQLFNIGIFPWFMIAATALFFDPSWPRRILPGSDTISPAHSAKPSASRQQWIIAGLFLYITVQLLVPLRHFLYPGYVSWTEEGHRFAWHMKLRAKYGRASFLLTNTKTGEHMYVKPEEYLTERQQDKLIISPDMVLQFAKFLEKKYEAGGAIEVRARVRTALNGRSLQWLIDPQVDLTTIPRSLRPHDWIVPLEQPYIESAE